MLNSEYTYSRVHTTRWMIMKVILVWNFTSNAWSNGHKMCLESMLQDVVMSVNFHETFFFFFWKCWRAFSFRTFFVLTKALTGVHVSLSVVPESHIGEIKSLWQSSNDTDDRVNNLNSQIRKWADCLYVYKNCKKSINDSVFSSWMEAKRFWTFQDPLRKMFTTSRKT